MDKRRGIIQTFYKAIKRDYFTNSYIGNYSCPKWSVYTPHGPILPVQNDQGEIVRKSPDREDTRISIFPDFACTTAGITNDRNRFKVHPVDAYFLKILSTEFLSP
jgi:hypothetical protein